jgi:hypothetical protein
MSAFGRIAAITHIFPAAYLVCFFGGDGVTIEWAPASGKSPTFNGRADYSRLAITSKTAVSTPNAAVIQRMQLIRM